MEREQLQQRIAALLSVQEIAQELMSELNLERLLHKILDSAVRVLNASDGSLLLWVPADELVFAVTQDPELLGHRIPADKGIAGWVFTNCEPLIVGEVRDDTRFFQEVKSGYRTHSLLAVPLMTPTEKIGVVEVLNKKSGEQFNEHDRDILTALAAQAATAIVNARLYQELEEEKNRIVAIEDQLHKKLARDLHDGPAQTLAAMIMDIEFILKLYEREPERVPNELRNLREAATKTLAQVRNTMFELRPVILETQGLKAAMEDYVGRLVKTEKMNIHLDIRNLDERLPPKVERLCFAIIQEAVGNIKKHAHAKNTWIIIERRAHDLVVAVRDDGRGFNVGEVERGYDSRGSLGMLNMKERSEVLGARLSINSAPGKGTLVSLIVPLADEKKPSTCDEVNETTSKAAGKRRKGKTGPITLRRKGTGPLVWPFND